MDAIGKVGIGPREGGAGPVKIQRACVDCGQLFTRSSNVQKRCKTCGNARKKAVHNHAMNSTFAGKATTTRAMTEPAQSPSAPSAGNGGAALAIPLDTALLVTLLRAAADQLERQES